MIKKIAGITILESIIGLAIGLFITGCAMTMILHLTRTCNEMIYRVNLEHSLQTALNLIQNDLKRAGYWHDAMSDFETNENNNPFLVDQEVVKLDSKHCLRLSYDINDNGFLPPLGAKPMDMRFGYRLIDETLQSRPSSASSFSCDSPYNEWENLIDPKLIKVTDLEFSLNEELLEIPKTKNTVDHISVKSFHITMKAQMIKHPNIHKEIHGNVLLQNHRYIPHS